MSKKYGPGEPPFIRVAALDIETLSTRMRPVITEIGFIVCDLPRSDYTQWESNIKSKGTVQLDILEQCKMGRHIDPDTIDFQERTFGRNEYRDLIYKRPNGDNGVSYAVDALQLVKLSLKGVDELWLNHPTFDAGRINTLAEDCGIFNGVWNYGSEMDVHSIKYKHGLEVEGDAVHRGLEDCYYNMNILSKFASTREQHWETGHGYVWKERS
jgi:hypothetical protein